MSLARRQIPSRLSLVHHSPSDSNFKDSSRSTTPAADRPEREIIRALSPTTERELRRSCSAVVLGLASPRTSTVPDRALPTPAFPKHQNFHGRTQSQAHSQPPLPQTQTQAQPWAQFDFKLPIEGSSSPHSISSSIDSTFSRTSSEMGTSSWSPTTTITHQSKSSDGDQFFHAQTADLTVLPPMPQKPMPGSPPARYAFAKTATARKMSLNYHQINPRASSIGAVAAEQQGGIPPVLARPTVINVARPKTASGIPGSPRVRNSHILHDTSTKPRSDSQGNVNLSGIGLGLGVEVQTARASTINIGGSPRVATPTRTDNTTQTPQSPVVKCSTPVPQKRETHHAHIRSVTSSPLLTNASRTSTSQPPKELARRRTDMDPPAHPRKFSLFPCQEATPVIIKDTPAPSIYTPPAHSIASRSMSIASSGRPRTSGGSEIPKSRTDSWDRPLPPLPAGLDGTNKSIKSKRSGKEKSEKTTFKSLRKQVLASFQNFSGSLKMKSSSKDKKKDVGIHHHHHHNELAAPSGIGVAA